MRPTRIILLAAALLAASCAEEEPEATPSFQKYVETKSGLVLYAPKPYAVEPTHNTGLAAGFRLEDVANETLAGIVETTSRRAGVQSSASAPFTSAAYAKSALENIVNRVKQNITIILPGSNPDEGAGDWSITTLRIGTTLDRKGNAVAYGRFALQFAPVYQLRSYEMFRYLAAYVLDLNWTNYPYVTDEYFAAGNSMVHFSIALAMYEPEGFFGAEDNSKRVAVSISAYPGNKSAPEIAASIDDLMTFKTLGTVKDKLVEKEKVFEVDAGAPPLDIVVALDNGGGMQEEAPTYRTELTEFLSGLYKSGEYDLRVGFVTNEGAEFVRPKDNKPFVSPSSQDPEVLIRGVIDEIWMTANGEYIIENRLLKNSLLAVTEEKNPGFRRADAPLLLFYLADRDDQSNKLDGSALAAFETYYAARVTAFDHAVIVAPLQDNCTGSGFEASGRATKLQSLADTVSHYFQDLCRNNHFAYKREVETWGESAVSPFGFQPPQPLAFTLNVSVNGDPIPQRLGDGYEFDPIGDRLGFSAAVEPVAGDIIKATYYALETPLPATAKTASAR